MRVRYAVMHERAIARRRESLQHHFHESPSVPERRGKQTTHARRLAEPRVHDQSSTFGGPPGAPGGRNLSYPSLALSAASFARLSRTSLSFSISASISFLDFSSGGLAGRRVRGAALGFRSGSSSSSSDSDSEPDSSSSELFGGSAPGAGRRGGFGAAAARLLLLLRRPPDARALVPARLLLRGGSSSSWPLRHFCLSWPGGAAASPRPPPLAPLAALGVDAPSSPCPCPERGGETARETRERSAREFLRAIEVAALNEHALVFVAG